MQVSLETTSTLERRLNIELPAEQVDTQVASRLKDTAKRVKIDGFRPGKVPLSVVKSRYGAGVRQEVLGELMQKAFIEAITEQKINPAGAPTVEEDGENKEGQPFKFSATFEVYPEITLASLEGKEVERPVSEVGDSDLEELIENLRKQRATYEETDKAAELNDQVNINFEGFIDEEAFEGGKGENHDLVLGSGSFIPGFEDQLVGAKAGEDKEVKVTFPEDYQAENLKGKEAVFKCTVNAVKQQALPELNEEFFEQFGVKEGGEEAFRAEVKKNMEVQLKQTLKDVTKSNAFKLLVEANPIEVPEALVNNEINNLKQQAVQQYNLGQAFDLEQIPSEMFKDQAKNNVVLGLLVGEVIKRDELKATDEAVDELLNDLAQSYHDPQEVINHYKGNPEMLRQVQGAALEDLVVEKLLAEAQVKEVSKTFAELTSGRN